jgi:thiol-disulfide isomerase/thioredoxin
LRRFTKTQWALAAFVVASIAVQYWAHKEYRAAPSNAIDRGDDAPGFAVERLDGGEISLASMRGRIVILDFWATWCAPCRSEFVALEKWRENESSSGLLDSVVVVAVNTGEERGLVERFVKEHEISFTVALDPDGDLAAKYGVTSLPTLVLIDRKGRVAQTRVGFDPMVGMGLSSWLRENQKVATP